MKNQNRSPIKHGNRLLGNILIIAQFVISGILIFMIGRLGVLPVNMLLYTVAIILALLLLTSSCVLLGMRRRPLRIAMYVLIPMIVVMFSVLSGYMYKSEAFIRDVAGESEERYGISVIVMDDSPAESLADLRGASFAYVSGTGSAMMEEGVREIKTEIGALRTAHPDNLSELADMLYSGDCDAVIIEESGRSQIAENHEDFDARTRTIWNHEITRTVSASSEGLDVTRDSFNIYLCGSDSRNNVEEVALNDLNMIVTVNPNTNQILLTSIPRDYFIELASYGEKDKLTHAGIFGAEEAMKSVEKFTGIRMDFCVKVSFAALVYVVDAIGGIDVESDTEFTAWTNPDIHIKKGMNHMYGVMALAYARERFAYENGDIHRAQNQAQVMREIATKASSPSILIHYDKLLDALARGMKTSMSDVQIRSLIRMQLDRGSVWTIRDYQMNGTSGLSKNCFTMPGKELYVMEPDMDTVNEALDRISTVMEGETVIKEDTEGAKE